MLLGQVILIRQPIKPTMKIKQIFAAATTLSLLFFALTSHALTVEIDVTNPGNWNWSSTVTNQPWPNGILPTTNNYVEVYAGVVITNDTTNAACDYLESGDGGNGTVVMAPGSTITIQGRNEGTGTATLTPGCFDPTATNCTVIYEGNAFWAMHTNYWNLVFAGWGNFFSGFVSAIDPGENMTIFGNWIVNGTNIAPDKLTSFSGVYVEAGTNITVLGNLYVGLSNSFNCSSYNIQVNGNTTIDGGLLYDQDATAGTNIFNNLTINPSSVILTNPDWFIVTKMGNTNADNVGPTGVYGPGNEGSYMGAFYVTDVNEWTILGSFTNNGITGFGTNYGSIDFAGTGDIAGSNALYLPTMTIDGTYTIEDTINLATNYPTINGTVVFDCANTNKSQIVLDAGTNWFWYSTNGTLDVINSGPPLTAGYTYQLFNNVGNTNYGGGFASITLPSLTGGLSWVTNLLMNGSISVAGAAARPIITSSHYNPATLQFTLTWTSVPGAMYTVQETPGLSPVGWSSLQTNIPSGGSTTTTTVTMPAGTKGFLRILVQ